METTTTTTTTTTTACLVRNLREEDLEAVIALDARNVGRRRADFYRRKLQQNLVESGIKVSLAAEVEGVLRGFLLARVQYGEFGRMEPVAVLDSLAVDPASHRAGVGHALLRQLRMNLAALHIPVLRTDVAWDQQAMLGFFRKEGFAPAPRLCLELPVRFPDDAGEPLA
jgi:ribosomal protein S18 acetylase RimI-like enzyme